MDNPPKTHLPRKVAQPEKEITMKKTTTRANDGLGIAACSPSYFVKRRLVESSAAFLAAGVLIGCVVSSFGPTCKMVAYGIAALWVMIAFWRIVRLNDWENAQGETTPPETESLVGVNSTDLFGVDGAIGRGFTRVEFRDTYGKKCSIQISSRAVCEKDDGTVDDPLGWLWLGIDDAEPQIMKSKAQALGIELPPGEVSGWMPYPIPDDVLLTTQMHLNERQVRGLIARLMLWLETGNLSPNTKTQPPAEGGSTEEIDE